MPNEIQVNVNLNDKNALKKINDIENAYQRLKKTLERQATIRIDGSKGIDAETASVRKLQQEYNKLHAAESKRRASEGREAFKGYQERVKEEEKFLKLQQKIQAEYDKMSVKNRQQDNKAMIDQMKRQSKEAEEYAKKVAKIQAEYDKLSNSKAKAESKARSADSNEAFKGYLQRAKEEEELLKRQEKIQAAYDKMSSANAKSRAKEQSAGAKEAFKGYLERAKEAEEFLKVQEKIQAAYDKESATRAKESSASGKEAFKGYIERAKEAENFLKLQEKIQAAYDKESNTRSKEREKGGQEVFKGYLERAAAAEKAAAAEEKLAAAQRKMGESWGTVNASQASNISAMAQYIRAQEGMENATVRATGAVHNSVGTFQTYSVSTKAAGQATQNYRVAVNTATGEVYALDKGVKSASVSFGNMGKTAFSMVKQLVGFTGVVQTLRSALSEMKAMNDEMVTYRKVTNATAAEMEKIRSASYTTAKKYGQTPSDFLAAASNMARAGYGANSAAMAELATKTQLVGDMTAEAASKFLLAVDAGYKYKGNIEQLTAVLDASNEADNHYATSIEKISEGMTLVASLAGSVHVPIEQLTAALGTMTASTQRSGAEMARGLRSIFLNVLKDTSTEIEEGVTVTEENIQSLTDALEKYGDASISAAQKAGKLINPMDAIASLAKAWKAGKLDEQTLFSISKDVAGQRYYNAFSALIQNYDMYQSMLESIAGSAGSAQKEVNAMLDSWTVKANQLKTTWTELVNNTISDRFIMNLLDGGTAALQFAGNLENLGIMAGGAYAAIKSLSVGIKNLQAGSKFGGFNLATSLIGVGIAAVGTWKAAYEKNIREAQEAAAKAVADAAKENDTYKTLQEIHTKYLNTEKGDIETLKTLQDELNKAVGEQGTAIDLVNGKYDDQKKKLAELTAQQRQAAIDSYRTALSSGVAAFKQSDLNGFFNFDTFLNTSGWSSTGVGYDLNDTALSNVLSGYFRNMKTKHINTIGSSIGFQKPKDSEGIIEFYKEVEDFYKFLGTYTVNAEKAGAGMQTIGEQYSALYQSFGSFVNAVKAAADPVRNAQEAIDELIEAGETAIDGVQPQAEQQVTTIEQKFRSLSDVIQAATDAKTKFDEAMQSSKADAMNDYITAFKTLKQEMKLGKVNSTAYYAAARMLLGDEAYEKTGGTSAGVRKALNTKGKSGSIMQAYDILSATYKDKNGKGKEIEGYGIYELLRNTKGFDASRLTTKDGKAYIPKLSDDDLSKVSKQWGGLSKDVILNWLNAFDQYDKKGKATDDSLKTKKQPEKTEAEKALESTQKQTTATQEQTTATQENTEAINALKEQLQEYNKPEESGGTEEPEKTEAEKAAETISEATTESKELDVGVSERTTEAAKVLNELVSAINVVISAAGHGDYNIDVSGKVEQDFYDKVTAIVNSVSTISELNTLTMNLSLGNDDFSRYVRELIVEKRKALIDLEADGSNAEKEIKDIENKERKTEVDVDAKTGKADDKIEDVVKGPYNANVDVNATITQQAKDEFKKATTPIYKTVKLVATYDADNSSGGGSGKPSSNGGLGVDVGGTGNGGGYYGWGHMPGTGGVNAWLKHMYATGTQYHHGGPALVNDGSGPELIVDRGRAFIAGHGRPSIVNLGKGAKVFTAGETRNILNNGGTPAYAMGARDMADGRGKTAVIDAPTLKNIWDKPEAEKKDKTKYKNEPSTIFSGLDIDKIKRTEDEDDKKKTKNSGSGGGSSKKKTDTEAFSKLSEMINYILGRIKTALDEQLSVIDKQIDQLRASREAAKEQNELEEKQKAVADAQKDLMDAMSERTVRYLGEDGKWHWMADQKNVKSATENLQSAQKNLSDYQSELAFNQQVQALENQKTALQDEYDKYVKVWSDIQDGVNTPTGTLSGLLSAVLAGGTDQQKTGAKAVKKTLIGDLKGGSYKKNYSEALSSIAKATSGTPLMPGDSKTTLASLIAASGSKSSKAALNSALAGTYSSSSAKTAANSLLGGTSGVNYNYYVNGVKIGNDAATTMPLSEVMRGLAVYSNSTT